MKVIDVINATNRWAYVRLQADFDSEWGDENPYGLYRMNDLPWNMVKTVEDREVVELNAYVDEESVGNGVLWITYKGI